ncbi:MAG: signal peptidase I, partial [Clostridia bacterium]
MKTFFLLLSLFVAGVGSGQPHQPIRAYIAEGDGMAPALKSNDRFLVDVTYYASHPIERGDIILFQAENDQQYVKRVIALPGETIEYKNDFLYI